MMYMAQLKVLIEGYTSAETGGHSCSTVTLVQNDGMSMIIDPGTLPSQKVLVDALSKEGLTADDINVVFITHSHMDHYKNIGMFPNAKALDYWGWWEGDFWKDCDGKVNENISIIKTPGHNYDGITLLVKTKEGIIAVCGDVIWKEDAPEDDKFATDTEALKKSREKVRELADWIVPGHGEMFKIKK